MTDHHYYATCSYGWVTAPTKEAAIKGLARYVGSSVIARARESVNGGLYTAVVRVDLPEKAHYTIVDHMPQTITKEDGVNEARKGDRVPVRDRDTVLITTVTGKYKSAYATP